MNHRPQPYLDSVERARLLLATDHISVMDRRNWNWIKPEGWLVSGAGAPWSKALNVNPEDRFTDETIKKVALWLDGLSMHIKVVFSCNVEGNIFIDAGLVEDTAIMANAQAVLTQGFAIQL